MTGYTDTIAQLVEIDAAEVQATKDVSGSRVNIILRKIRRYHQAQDAAPKFGLIGVGIISFADTRLAKFSQRIERLTSTQGGQ